MTDTVTSVANLPAVQAIAPSAPVSAPPASAVRDDAPAPDRAAAEPVRKPLTVDVQNDSGVFVYTLRDPVTDTVLAVIPREAVRADRDGRHIDQKV